MMPENQALNPFFAYHIGSKPNQFVSYEPYVPEQEVYTQNANPKKNLSIKMPTKEFKSANTIGSEEANQENDKMKSTIRADETLGDNTRNNIFNPDSPTRIPHIHKSKNRLNSKAQDSIDGNKTEPKIDKKEKQKKSDNTSDKNGIDITYQVD